MDALLSSVISSAAASIVSDVFKSSSSMLIRSLESFSPVLQRDTSKQHSKTVEKALARTLSHFVEIFQRELEHSEGLSFIRDQFAPTLKTFLKSPQTIHILGVGFELRTRRLDEQALATLWADLGLPSLPADFAWDIVCGLFLREIQRELKQDADLRAIFNSENLNRVAEAIEDIRGIDPGFDVNGYRRAIVNAHQHLKLDAFDVSGQDYRVRLRNVFIPQDVREALPLFELPKDVLARLQQEGAVDMEPSNEGQEQMRRRYFEHPLVGIEQVLEDPTCRRFVVLGDPGAGKSSLAHRTLLQWAEHGFDQALPILIKLRAYSQDIGLPNSFLEYLETGEGCTWHFNQRHLDSWLRTNTSFIIFEGLDEIFDSARRHEITRAILRFTSEYPAARVMATSRTIGYNPQELRNGGFRHFTLQDFSVQQIETFVKRWHEEVISNPVDRDLLGRRLLDALAESESLRELATNPLLLTMLVMLNRNQELPRDRADAYRQMSRLLLYQWDVSKYLREHGGLLEESVGRNEKEQILRRIAVAMQKGTDGATANLIRKRHLEELISDYLAQELRFEHPAAGARIMIQQLRERNFVLCQTGADYFSFVHRTFLEYYCASAFVERFYETLSLEDLWSQTFVNHWADENWREVLKLIIGMLPPIHSAKLIGWLLEEDSPRFAFETVFIAADCWKELSHSAEKRSVASALRRQLLHAAEFRPGRSSEPRVDVNGIVNASVETRRLQALEIRTRAIASLGAAFAPDKDAFDWLKACVLNRKNSAVREAALRTLARY
jgi:GTPase SAR1 family protein